MFSARTFSKFILSIRDLNSSVIDDEINKLSIIDEVFSFICLFVGLSCAILSLLTFLISFDLKILSISVTISLYEAEMDIL